MSKALIQRVMTPDNSLSCAGDDHAGRSHHSAPA